MRHLASHVAPQADLSVSVLSPRRRLLRALFSGLGALALVVSTIAPAYAVTSSIGSPALGGLPAAPGPAAESAGPGVWSTSPRHYNHVPTLLYTPQLSLESLGSGLEVEGMVETSPVLESVEAIDENAPPGMFGPLPDDTEEASLNSQESEGGANMALMSGGPQDPLPKTKFTPPDTPYNGAFTRSFPIEVPPFFELTPHLVLGYQSGDNRLHAGDGFSPLGVGWSLSGGSLIERTSLHGGVPRFDATDVFTLDGNTLLDCIIDESTTRATPSCDAGGTHTGRYETYERINKLTGSNSWEVTARDGTVSLYSPLATFNPSGTQDTRLRNDYRWLLASVTDTDGNVVSYSYDCSALPTCIVTSLSFGTSSVEFSWETRPDSFTYATGISLGTVDKRLKTVAVKTGTSLIRAYKLSYAVSANTKRSLLSSFRQYGSDATITAGTITAGTALPADSFTYFDMSSRRTGAALDKVTADTAAEPTQGNGAQYPAEPNTSKLVTDPSSNNDALDNYLFGDFSGDGRQDLIVKADGGWGDYGFYASGAWSGSFTAPHNGTSLTNVSVGPLKLTDAVVVGDFNGDGKDDVLGLGQLNTSNQASQTPQPYRSQLVSAGYAQGAYFVGASFLNGTAVIGGAVAGLGPSGSSPSWGLNDSTQKQKFIVADFNGDGLDDVFRGEMFLSTGVDFTREVWANEDWGRVGDFNGDGMADLFVLDGTNGTTSKLLISTGSGFDSYPLNTTLTSRPDYNWPEFESTSHAYDEDFKLGVWVTGDWNGDGATDFARRSRTSNSSNDPKLDRYDAIGSAFEKSLWSTGAFPGLNAFDLNGDGRPELSTTTSGGTTGVLVIDGVALTSVFGWSGTTGVGFVGDYNGDGRTDSEDDNPDLYNNSVLPDLLKTHTLSSGGSVDVAYLPSTYWQ
ncbi:MAG: SpvB/TcaC N-terminal domain-containing protein, partial [Devosia sp.]